jgi:sugar phosphate isomerase/epimerase
MSGDSSYQVDWKEVLRALDDINYSGVYSFELNMRKFGNALEDATRFLGSYLRRFVDGTL